MQKTKTNLTDDSCLDGLFNDIFTAVWARETDRVITEQTIYFSFFDFWPALTTIRLVVHVIRRPAAHRRCSSLRAFTLQNASFKKSLLLLARRVALTRPLSRADSVPTSSCLQQARTTKKKTEIAKADPTGHVNLTKAAAQNNRLYLTVHCVHAGPPNATNY